MTDEDYNYLKLRIMDNSISDEEITNFFIEHRQRQRKGVFKNVKVKKFKIPVFTFRRKKF